MIATLAGYGNVEIVILVHLRDNLTIYSAHRLSITHLCIREGDVSVRAERSWQIFGTLLYPYELAVAAADAGRHRLRHQAAGSHRINHWPQMLVRMGFEQMMTQFQHFVRSQSSSSTQPQRQQHVTLSENGITCALFSTIVVFLCDNL